MFPNLIIDYNCTSLFTILLKKHVTWFLHHKWDACPQKIHLSMWSLSMQRACRCLLQILQILKDIDVNIRYLLEVAAVCLGRSYTLSNSRKYKKLLHQDKSEKKNKYRKIDKHEVGGSHLSVSLLCCHNNLIIAAILVWIRKTFMFMFIFFFMPKMPN